MDSGEGRALGCAHDCQFRVRGESSPIAILVSLRRFNTFRFPHTTYLSSLSHALTYIYPGWEHAPLRRRNHDAHRIHAAAIL